jgi:hypothetical protein
MLPAQHHLIKNLHQSHALTLSASADMLPGDSV